MSGIAAGVEPEDPLGDPAAEAGINPQYRPSRWMLPLEALAAALMVAIVVLLLLAPFLFGRQLVSAT